jgi:DNA-binding ferritin-like protein (Dps family)
MAKKKAMDLDAAVKLILDSEEDSVPQEMYENPDLYLALTAKEADYISMAWLVSNHMPDTLRSDRALMEKLVRHTPMVFGKLDAPLNEDLELFELAMADDLKLFEFAGPGIKSNKKLVQDFLERWKKQYPTDLSPINWIPFSLVKELKIIESFGVQSFPAKSGHYRFVIELSQYDVTPAKAEGILEKHASFIQTLIKDKKAELFGEIFQQDNTEDQESVETTAYLYIKDLTLEDMDDYLNALAGKKVKASNTMVFDIDNPNYMNYEGGEVSSGSVGSDYYDEDFSIFDNVINPRNLSGWPIKVLDAYL